MSYDLRRLRLKGLIARKPGTHRYEVTPYGRNIASMLTRLHQHVLRPALAAAEDPEGETPEALSKPLKVLSEALGRLCEQAHLKEAA